jgi:hypothetical protein
MSSNPKTKSYKEQFTLEERIALCEKNNKRFNGKTIVAIAQPANGAPEMPKKEFVVPIDMCFASLAASIRRRLEETKEQGVPLLGSDQALFYFIRNTMPPAAHHMGLLHKEYKDPEDGLLYIVYTFESTFG